jgi:hypothetical protein
VSLCLRQRTSPPNIQAMFSSSTLFSSMWGASQPKCVWSNMLADFTVSYLGILGRGVPGYYYQKVPDTELPHFSVQPCRVWRWVHTKSTGHEQKQTAQLKSWLPLQNRWTRTSLCLSSFMCEMQ